MWLTACVTRRWAGRDDADLTENVQVQKQLLLAGESHLSGARDVRWLFVVLTPSILLPYTCQHPNIFPFSQ